MGCAPTKEGGKDASAGMKDAHVEEFSDDVAACTKRDSPGDGKIALAFEDGVLGVALCTAKHQAGVLIVSKVKNRQAHEAGLKRCAVLASVC